MITLEQFRNSRREVEDLSTAVTDAGGDLAGQRGYVYAGRVYITIHGTHVGLVLDDGDWHEHASQLPALERRLYEWAAQVGALDSEV